MENKIYLKNTISKIIICVIVLFVIFIITNIVEYNLYNNNYNHKLNSISNNLKEKYPDIEDNEIFEIIQKENGNNSFFKKYGYQNNDVIIVKNNKIFTSYILIESFILILVSLIISYLYLKYNKKKDAKIKNIVNLIDRINHHNYSFDMDELSEDELSILKNEIYKTTIMLRNIADVALEDKKEIKKSLEDISHQLKTPLTSILINLDNILDNPNIKEEQRNIFIRKIKKDVYNIKTMVDTLLKLSKFDVNTIEFNREDNNINDLIKLSIDKVSSLADLKNIKIEVKWTKDKLYCDKMWEIEAISNILKNAIEHSYDNSVVEISYNKNKVYKSISIKNSGKTISKNDQKHIFERFYKTSNSTTDSIGIGLSLAKSIIEKDNGSISLNSKNDVTEFIIKYM